ncbi:hypothetical protein [Methylococcus geothermalis]|uniref:Uncharacterized protein n=1 Tax=Methylococcus geothermalis TaxID=2681310 RepID=A0A858QAI1_9GAMM|nr:hypothetical protein [Methylococcus geothermalis]QJD30907.1 hypothetical protein GNH96_13675 [Methylococcus geothermalis]
MKTLVCLAAVGLMSIAGSAVAERGINDGHQRRFDFGKFVEKQLTAYGEQWFGIARPLAASSTLSIDAATAEANPRVLASFGKGLRAQVVTAAPNAGANIDMMVACASPR